MWTRAGASSPKAEWVPGQRSDNSVGRVCTAVATWPRGEGVGGAMNGGLNDDRGPGSSCYSVLGRSRWAMGQMVREQTGRTGGFTNHRRVSSGVVDQNVVGD